MADNINVTPGTGVTVAGDEIAGVLHQRVKVVLGNDGVNDGDISTTNPMPVEIVGGVELEFKNDVGNPLPVNGTVTANIGTTGGLALNSSLSTINITLGSPFQAGGSIGNTAFGRTWSLLNTTDSVNVGNFPSTFGVTQSTSPWTISGTVTANAGTNLNTSLLALDSTVAKDASLATINTSINTLLKPASTLSAVTTLGTITNALPAGTNTIGKVDQGLGGASAWKIDGSAVTQPVSGSLGRTWNLSSGSDSVAAVQSGSWTTDRTWSLLNTTDSVNVGNFPATFGVTQSTSPWVISGTVTANAGTNLNTSALNLETTQVAFKSANHTDLAAINTTLGTPMQNSGGSVSVANTPNVIIQNATGALDYNSGTDSAQTLRVSANIHHNGTDLAYNAGVTSAQTLRVTLPTDQSSIPVTQSGTWTVQPGNTANTTAWKVDASSVAVPITDNSGSLTVDNAGTFAVQASLNTGSNIIGKVSIDQTTPGTTNKVSIGTDGTVAINAALPAGSNVIGHVIVDSGTITANAGTDLNTSALNLESTQTAFKSTNHSDLLAINTTLGSPFQAGGSIANTSFAATQSTASNFNAQVVGNVANGVADSGNPIKVGGKYNATPPAFTDGQRGDLQIDSDGSLFISIRDNPVGLASAANQTNGSQKAQIVDASGNVSGTFINNQIPTRDVLNVSSQYQAISVTNTASEAKGAGTRLSNRKVIVITPTNGTVYWGTNNSVTTSSGTPIFANQSTSISVTDNIQIWLISGGTVDVRVMEGS